jgi:AcrR family transcriptional regulator
MTLTSPPPPAATVPLTRDRHGDRRDAILWAAIDQITAVGYHGTSIRDIAADARVTATSIYHYFGSKQGLLQEIMLAAITEVVTLTRSALDAAGPAEPPAQLAALMRAWIEFHTTRQPLAIISATELRTLGPEASRSVLLLRDEQEAMFRSVIERGVELGCLRTPYPREATRAVLQMGRDVSAWYVPGAGKSPAVLAEEYVDLALSLLRASPTTFE